MKLGVRLIAVLLQVPQVLEEALHWGMKLPDGKRSPSLLPMSGISVTSSTCRVLAAPSRVCHCPVTFPPAQLPCLKNLKQFSLLFTFTCQIIILSERNELQ